MICSKAPMVDVFFTTWYIRLWGVLNGWHHALLEPQEEHVFPPLGCEIDVPKRIRVIGGSQIHFVKGMLVINGR